MNKTNQEIRKLMKSEKLTMWMVADALHIAEYTLVRWMRHELSPEKQAAVLAAIQRAKEGLTNGED